MSSVIRSLMIKIGADLTEAQKGLNQISKDLNNVGKSFSSVGATLTKGLTVPIAGAAAASFKFAADMQDAMGATEQIFGKASDAMKSWADGLETYYGIAEGEALTYANTMGAMLQNIGGLSEDEAAKQSQTLVALAGDLTAMFGGTTESAVQALTGALKGNNAMLDNYGMAVNDATIKQKAMEMGLIEEGETLDLASKQAATLALIMEQTGAAQGQAARESDGASGSLRTMVTEAKNLAASLGETLLPMITPVIQKINEWVQKFSELDSGTKEMIVKMALAAAAIGPVFSVVGKLTSGIGGLIKGVGAAGKALSAGKGLMGALSAMISPAGLALAAIAAIAAAAYLIYTNWDAIKEFFVNLWESVKEIFTDTWEWIEEMFLKYTPAGLVISHWEEIKQFFIDLWDNVKIAFSDAWEWVKDMFLSYTPAGLVISRWEEIKQFFIDLWGSVKQAFSDAWEWIKSMFLNYTPMGLVISHWDTIKAFFTELWDKVKKTFSDAWDAIKTKVDSVTNAISGVWKWFKEDVLGWVNDLVDKAKTAFSGLWDKVEEVFGNIKDWISDKIGAVTGIFNGFKDTIDGVIDKIGDFLDNLFNAESEANQANLSPSYRFPSYDVGTPYVPATGLALIHKGEAVIPADQNPYTHGALATTTINIYPKSLSQSEVDYLCQKFNAALGVIK